MSGSTVVGRNKASSPLGVRGNEEAKDWRDLEAPPEDLDLRLAVPP